MPSRIHHARRLATALAAGSMANHDELIHRAAPLMGDIRKARWLKALARNLSLEFAEAPRPTIRKITDRILHDPGFTRAWILGKARIGIGFTQPEMAPAPGIAVAWGVPAITTLAELADLLRLHPDDLGWLTARNSSEHYRYRWQIKPKSGRYRLIESPKELLKGAQRRVLRKILNLIPPHEAAHGFRPGGSIRNFVEPHSGKPMLLRFDLEDFFPSITSTRIFHIFLTAGYPENVAQALTAICTHSTPSQTIGEKPLNSHERSRLTTRHLPQGAPTSPALANLSAYRLDCRLLGLAQSIGATYTRYADDLLFSGDQKFARKSKGLQAMIGGIILEERFSINHRKTRVLRQAQKQHAAGLILNQKPNIDRREIDQLKAILTNCIRFGPESQNRNNHPDFAAHLAGKLSWIRFIQPQKALKLESLFERIDWPA
ncbi:RNA-directed DNA polymerase [Luteolibacter pohnpeiensis]|uniref:RNA-directed DNA polymerase n=1 Tax=Luteolibacter pohnpeiensis TaxID=454153 RepID=A0A934SAJ4_9BACT|nr:reverse transcriptase family protein [Luteolibacter pohnpeiensis]MBK1884309.1 RNA-directed DNA polymerase [Luteolibacter pohnpeiensis]